MLVSIHPSIQSPKAKTPGASFDFEPSTPKTSVSQGAEGCLGLWCYAIVHCNITPLFLFGGGPGLPSRRPRNFQLLFLSSTLFGFKLRWRRFRRNIENLYRFLVLAITHGVDVSREVWGAVCRAHQPPAASPLRLHIRASQWAGSPRLSDTEPFRPETHFGHAPTIYGRLA